MINFFSSSLDVYFIHPPLRISNNLQAKILQFEIEKMHILNNLKWYYT